MTFLLALAVAALTGAAAAQAATVTVTVDLNTLTLDAGTSIETGAPGFGNSGPVALTWDAGGGSETLVFATGGFSGNKAAYCSLGFHCRLDIAVVSGQQVTLETIVFGSALGADRTIGWALVDREFFFTVASSIGTPVSATTGATVQIGLASPVGFSFVFGPDGTNGGLTSLTYSYPQVGLGDPEPIPVPASALLLAGALAGLAAQRRRRAAT
jgi:hypothetical protein